MDKAAVLDALLELLESELDITGSAARDAADYATDEESRAESQWDTQGLEASYLAAGQAGHAKVLIEEIQTLRGTRSELLRACDRVIQGALVDCRIDGGSERFYFAPVAGGESVTVDGAQVTIITPHSPVAHRMLGKRVGESFEMPNGAAATITAVE